MALRAIKYETVNPYALPGLMKGSAIKLRPVLTKSRVEDIRDLVCEETQVTVKQIESKVRKREYVLARQIFCALSKKYSKASLKTIGFLIGDRDHTTVIASVNKFNQLCDVDKEYSELVRRIEIKIL